MHVRAHVTPASAPGGHTWETEHDVVEVPDDLGTDLVRIAGQFSEVLPSDPAHPNYVEPDPEDLEEDEGDEDDDSDADSEDLIGLSEPPRTGPQASKVAWQEYAEALGVGFPAGATRDEIIKLVDQRPNISE